MRSLTRTCTRPRRRKRSDSRDGAEPRMSKKAGRSGGRGGRRERGRSGDGRARRRDSRKRSVPRRRRSDSRAWNSRSRSNKFDCMEPRVLAPGTHWQVYCDLDGVLADFDRGVAERTGTAPSEFRKKRKMWKRLAPPRTESFFRDLPWMRDGEELWSYIKHLSPAILSGSPSGDWAAPQKKKWCVEHLPELPIERVHIVDPCDKKLYSHSAAVLVDDWIEHKKPWESKGGIFIHYTTAARSIKQLGTVLQHLVQSGALPPAGNPAPEAAAAA